MIAAHLSSLGGEGLVLSNGEFGERLLDHIERFNVVSANIKINWGEQFDYSQIENYVAKNKNIKWLWFTHCETSTGILNDLPLLKSLCLKYSIKLCVDIISTIGLIDIDLQGVYMASASSNKGLESIPGLALVFHNGLALNKLAVKTPRYLDIKNYTDNKIPFTLSSSQIHGLQSSLKNITPAKFTKIRESSKYLLSLLMAKNYQVLYKESSVPIITVELPKEIKSYDVGCCLEKNGVIVSYNSHYLLDRNWIQFCVMSECEPGDLLYAVIAFNQGYNKLLNMANNKKAVNSVENNSSVLKNTDKVQLEAIVG